MANWVPIPVAEGGEAHGGRHKCYSQGEGGVSTQEEGEHTGHTHGEKLTKGMNAHSQIHAQRGSDWTRNRNYTTRKVGEEGARREYLHELPH